MAHASEIFNDGYPEQAPPVMTDLHKLALAMGQYATVEAILDDGRLAPLDNLPLAMWQEQELLVGRSDEPTDRWLNNTIVQTPPNKVQIETALELGLAFTIPRAYNLQELRWSLRQNGYVSEPGDVWLRYSGQQLPEPAPDVTIVRISQEDVTCNEVRELIDPSKTLESLFTTTLEAAYCDGKTSRNPYGQLDSHALEAVREAWAHQGADYLFDAYVMLTSDKEPVAVAATSSLTNDNSQVTRIMNVGCVPERRGEGYGRAVVRACIKDILQAQRTPILQTIPGAYPEQFYRRLLGFQHIVTTDSFYNSDMQPACIDPLP